MIRHLIITSIRNFGRNFSFSIINLLGFSLSMSLGLFILIIMANQLRFDDFHQNEDRIYRINTEAIRKSGGTEPYASSPNAVATAVRDEYSLTDAVVRLHRGLNGDVKTDENVMTLRGLYADPEFFEVFNFALERGSPGGVLKSPHEIVLTAETAIKLFGDEDPVGKTITFENDLGTYTVTGVLKPFVGQTHFEFEALASFSTIPVLEQNGITDFSVTDWKDYYRGYNYLRLNEGVSEEDVMRALEGISARHYGNLDLETRDKGYRFYLQPLSGITPGPILSNNMGGGVPSFLLYILGAFALIVLVMACLNYSQLTVAKSLSRAREIGLRKISGAGRSQVFGQFISESIVFCLLSLVLSYLFLQALIPAFNTLRISSEFSFDFAENASTLASFIVFAVLCGVVAGLFPALYLSSFKPLSSLRSKGEFAAVRKFSFRKALMVFQFSVSLIFILLVFIVRNQMSFMTTYDYGINDERIVTIPLGDVEFETFSAAIAGVGSVERVGAVSHRLGTWEDRASDYKRNPGDEAIVMRDFCVDANYLEIIDAPFIAGRNFDPVNADADHQVILNRKALQLFNLGNPDDAIGKTIMEGDSILLEVSGVVDDFNFRPLSYEIGPVAFRFLRDELRLAAVQLSTDEVSLAIPELESAWQRIEDSKMQWNLMQNEIDDAYAQAGFEDFLIITGYVAFLAISIACLGILGMAMFTTKSRTKEIGIRKVLGASVGEVTLMLSRSFISIVMIAVAIALPVTHFLGNAYLEIYAFKAPVDAGIYISGVLIVCLLGGVTVSSQTISTARLNPVDSIRQE